MGLTPALVLVNHDLLSCGPLPPFGPLEDWRNVRQDYLRSLDREDPTFTFADQDRDLSTNPERLRTATTITLWIGTGLAEQLLLAWVVAFLRRLAVDISRLQIIQFGWERGHEVVSVGMLNPAQFNEHPRPTTLDDAAVREAIAAWDAVTASEPDALLDFLAAREHFLPFLHRSLSALLYRYPDITTGLNTWERHLLRHAREQGPRATRVVGYTMTHDLGFPDWAADSYLFDRLHRLADDALQRPLLTLTGNTQTLRGTEVHLTQSGEQVLAGNANAVEWNGVDDWVGGVHLDSRRGRVWYHRHQTLVRGS